MDFNFSCVVSLDNTKNITPFLWTPLLENSTAEISYGCATAALVILLCGTPLNLFVILTVLRKKLYKVAAVIPMLNLAVCNFLVCLLILPFVIITGFSTEFIFGSSDYVRCKVCSLGIVNVALPVVSLYTIALMSVGRFLYLKKPLQYNSIVTPARMVAILTVIWTFGVVVSLPPLFGFGSIRFSYTVATCVPVVAGNSHVSPNWYYYVLFITLVTVPIVVLFVMYTSIVCIARQYILKNARRFALLHEQSAVELQVSSNNADDDTNHDKIINQVNRLKQFRLVQLLCAIFAANLITWAPVIALVVTVFIVNPQEIPAQYYSVAFICFLLQVILQPLLQVILVYELKETVIAMWISFKRLFRALPIRMQ